LWRRPLPKLVCRAKERRSINEKDSRMDLRERRCEGVNYIHLVQDMGQWWILVNTVMNFQVL
jgi:hypothetical protein